MYQTVETGSMYSESYRMYFKNEEGPISPFHDIPLHADNSKKLYNMVVEIPRWTNAKMEINLKEPLNPIKQDVKKGKVRFVSNCFPHHGYIWNYGALPQTWENPVHLDDSTGAMGDNDPIDVVEIGYRVAKRGQVLSVKILGCIALIDEGETDWKIIAIDHEDPIAPQVNDLQDVDKFFPGLLKATVEWFKIYKIPDGKPENQFAFNGEAKNRDFAVNVVEQVHEFWKALIHNEANGGDISCSNTTIEKSPYKIGMPEAGEILSKAPEKCAPAAADPKDVDKWHFVTLQKD
ncbi:Inorganic pyrophosphatase [Polyplax serrata]|uniref:Inorganic pyrophosphatase n=1 Tax=Polyplax serrata TaxID=468196 RepID=A0AAN8SG57_POLSC